MQVLEDLAAARFPEPTPRQQPLGGFFKIGGAVLGYVDVREGEHRQRRHLPEADLARQECHFESVTKIFGSLSLSRSKILARGCFVCGF